MKQLYLDTNELGQTYLHFCAAQNDWNGLEQFFFAVLRGEANIQALRKPAHSGIDAITTAAVVGNWAIVDLIILKLTTVFKHAIPEIAKTPIMSNGKTITQITFEGMNAENVALCKFGMTSEHLSKLASRLVKLDDKLARMLKSVSEPKLSKSSPEVLESTAIGEVLNSSPTAWHVTAVDALTTAQLALASLRSVSAGSSYRLF